MVVLGGISGGGGGGGRGHMISNRTVCGTSDFKTKTRNIKNIET